MKSFFFEDNLNYIFIPILMNKFYYFTLNYYCLYTSEETKKFEIISGSSLISFYILIWNVAMLILKSIIPDEKVDDDYNYFNILYIIQLIFACIPSFFVAFTIIVGFISSLGLLSFVQYGFDCEELKSSFFPHRFLFCLCSILFCFGGLWLDFNGMDDCKIECCHLGDFCDT